LVVTTPEFHSTNVVQFSGESSDEPEQLEPTTKSLKTVVYLFLEGGADTFNLLVPHSDCSKKDMYEEYKSVRGQIALSKDKLLTISTGGEDQVCSTFGLHPNLPILKSLYEESDALFFSNTGFLFEPVTQEDYKEKNPTQLFAHNVARKNTREVDAFQEAAGTGVLGRMADILTRNEFNTGSFSVGKNGKVLEGVPLLSPPTFFIGKKGVSPFNPNPSGTDMNSIISDLNNATTLTSGIFAKTWSTLLDEAQTQTVILQRVFDDFSVNTTFPEDNNIGRQLQYVSNVMKANEMLNTDRLFFNAEMNGYDSHADVNTTLDINFSALNDALASFVTEMKDQGKWEDTVLIMASDFGRTLTPNGGDGSDHAWGGNYFMIGGGVDGGRILGSYPDDLTEDGPLNIGRGRLIPTTSWDKIMNGIAQWTGLSDTQDLNEVLPNRNNFGALFQKADLFI